MLADEFARRINRLLIENNCDEDWCASSDPDSLAAFKTGADGYLYIPYGKTMFKVADIVGIYISLKYDSYNMHMFFANNDYLKFDLMIENTEELEFVYNGKYYHSYYGYEIIKNIGNDWDGDPYIQDENTLISYIGTETEIRIPDGVSIIGEQAFSSDRKIKKVILPDSVKIISNNAFSNSELEEIDLNKIQSIGEGAFRGCNNLQRIEIPETAVSIGIFAFIESGIKNAGDIKNHSKVKLRDDLFGF